MKQRYATCRILRIGNPLLWPQNCGASSSCHFDFDQELETAKAFIKEFESGQREVAEVATQIKIDAVKSEEDKRKRINV